MTALTAAQAVPATASSSRAQVRSWRSDASIALCAANLAAATFGLAVKIHDAVTDPSARATTVAGRWIDELAYFTIQSNLLVIATCVALLAGARSGSRAADVVRRPGSWWWTVRSTALMCITVTALVYYSLLAGDEHFHGVALAADVAAHLVSPVLFVGAWLLVGPHEPGARRPIAWVLAFPAGWVALTMIRGAVVHVYPYDFVDVAAHGYGPVTATIVAMLAGAFALACGMRAVEQRLRRR
jgi:hypothetical protein